MYACFQSMQVQGVFKNLSNYDIDEAYTIFNSFLHLHCFCSDTFTLNNNLGQWKRIYTLLSQLGKIKSKQTGTPTKVVLLHQENSPAHKSLVAMAAVCDFGFDLVDLPLNSPDLAAISTPDLCAVAFSRCSIIRFFDLTLLVIASVKLPLSKS